MTCPRATLSVCLACALLAGACRETTQQGAVADDAGDTTPAATGTTEGHSDTLSDFAFSCEGLEVEAACGACQFGMPGDDCALAIRVGGLDGTRWYVEGTGIDDHGDAHAADGFCNAVRHAVVSGHVADGRFVATSFELVE